LGDDQQKGAELAAESYNSQGGVLGRKVEILVRDSQFNGGVALRKAKELVFEQKVDFIAGSLSGAVSKVFNEFFAKSKVIYMGFPHIQRSNTMNRTVGMIGLGIMGSAMSANLLKAGFKVKGYDIVPEKIDALVRMEGSRATSCKEVASACDVVVTVLPSIESFHEAIQGQEGVIAGARPELVVVECSTLPIPVKEEGRKALEAAGGVMLDCPLSGTGAQALLKDLAVYASGERTACEKCVPVLEGFARSHYYLGEFGMGSKMKFVANLLVAIHNLSAAEAFVLGAKAGLDRETILKVIRDGAGTSRMFEVRGPMMVAGHYDEATMKVDVFQKDMKIINSFAAELQCPTPLLAAAAQIYTSALARGRAKQDTAAVCAVLEEMAGIKRN
jgi:putative dehydrogenase